MGAMPTTQRMTADEYLALPYSEERRWVQLVEGELIVDQPLLLHQAVKGELEYALRSWVRSGRGRGLVTLPLDVKLDERNVFGPDLLWYPEETAPDIHAVRPYPGPRLAVDVRSPSDTAASEVLIFRRSEPHALSFDVALELERSDTLTSPQLEAFELPLVELFPE
jgi:Uma2 family endonuclease